MASSLMQRAASAWGHVALWLRRQHSHPPVDVEDPLGGALKDADVLIAFAAQSRRSIDATKVLALTTAAAKAADVRAAGGRLVPADATAFWVAYDAIAVQIAPLSAYSIRSSVLLNRKRFITAMLTPTAITGLLALLVFYVCLSLQGFWVAGKEMIERAEALDKGKSELVAEIGRSAAEVARARSGAKAKADELARLGYWNGPSSAASQKARDNPRVAALEAQLQMADATIDELLLQADSLNKRLEDLSNRSRPLEALMLKWHKRAGAVCDWRPLGLRAAAFLCPVEVDNGSVPDDRTTLRDDILRLQSKIKPPESSEAALERSRSAYFGAQRFEQNELMDKRRQLARADADHFNRIVSEVRMITANLGAYLIALTMGLLGSLTFIMRTLSQQLRDHTFVPVSFSEVLVRLCLGAIAGVFGSLLASSGDPAFKSLPPIFIPFVFGYGIEILFSMLDRVVRSFTQPDNTSASGAGRG